MRRPLQAGSPRGPFYGSTEHVMAGYVSVEYLGSICLYRYLIGGNNKIPQRYTRGCDDSCPCNVPSLETHRALSSGSLTQSPYLLRLLLLHVGMVEEIVGHGEHREHCCCVPIGVGHTEQGYGDVH